MGAANDGAEDIPTYESAAKLSTRVDLTDNIIIIFPILGFDI